MKKFLSIFLLNLATLSAAADTITKPHIFSAGTPAKAAEVNANFDTVYNQVNKLGGAITVDSAKRVGIGTATPAEKLSVQGVIHSTGGIKFPDGSVQTSAASGSSGGGDGHSLDAADGAPVDAVYVDGEGRVGIGTTSPTAKLHVGGGDAGLGAMISGGGGIGTIITQASLLGGNSKYFDPDYPTLVVTRGSSSRGASILIGHTHRKHAIYGQGNYLSIMTSDSDNNWHTALAADTSGNVGIGTTSPQGKLDVNGTIYQHGAQLHADYVFEPNYQLESIAEHARFMWREKHLPAIPKARKDAQGQDILEVGAHRKGMLEELEKAHVYIEQLHRRLEQLTALVCRDHAEAEVCTE